MNRSLLRLAAAGLVTGSLFGGSLEDGEGFQFGPGSAFADCSATCDGGSCTFDGILNTPLGEAVLSVDPNCNLLIGNVGSSGQDGVVQVGLSGEYMVTTLATPNLSGSAAGMRIEIRQVGFVNGENDHEISVVQVVNVTGSILRLTMDCTAIQVDTYAIEIYNDEGAVFVQAPVAEAPVLLLPKGDLVAMACALLPNDELYTTVSFAGPVPFTIQTHEGNLGPYTGTCLKMRGFSPGLLPVVQQAIENRFKDTGPIPIVSLYSGELPSEDHVCPAALVPIEPTTWGRLKAIYRD